MTIISSSNGNSASSRTPRAGTSGPIRSSRTTEFGSRSCGLGGRCFPETDRKADSTSSVPTKSVGLSTSRLPRGTARVARNSAPVGFIADLIASACSRRLDDISTVPRRAALSRSALSAYISNAVRWTSVRSPKGCVESSQRRFPYRSSLRSRGPAAINCDYNFTWSMYGMDCRQSQLANIAAFD